MNAREIDTAVVAPSPALRRLDKGLILSASSLMSAGYAGIGLVMPLYALDRLNARADQIGFAAALMQGTIILTTAPFGKLSDRIGHRTLPVICAFIIALLGVTMAHTTAMLQVYFLQAGIGLALAAYWPSMEASTGEDSHDRKLLWMLGAYNTSWAVGVALGPYLAGFLFGKAVEWAFYAPAAMAIAAAVSILARPRLNGEEGHVPPVKCPYSGPVGGQSFLWVGWVANFGGWFVVGVLRNLLQTLAKTLSLTGAQVGFLMFLWAMSMGAMYAALSLTMRWTYRLMPLLFFQVVLAGGCLAIFHASTMPLLSLGVAMAGIGCGMTYFASLFYSQDGHADRGHKSGIHETVLAAGSMVGPLICGKAVVLYSVRAPYLICAVTVFGCMAAQVLLLKRRPV